MVNIISKTRPDDGPLAYVNMHITKISDDKLIATYKQGQSTDDQFNKYLCADTENGLLEKELILNEGYADEDSGSETDFVISGSKDISEIDYHGYNHHGLIVLVIDLVSFETHHF